MPKIFRKKSQSPGAPVGDDEHDDMTITSGWSQGASSVSDRIMGRMKRNLSFGQGGGSGNARNTNSSSSVGSGGKRRFGGRRMSAQTVAVGGGGGSSNRRDSLPRMPVQRFRSFDGTASSVGVGAMEEMDSNEAMTLKGQTMGRRRTAPPRHYQKRLSKMGLTITDGDGDDEPTEYSLAKLRSMNGEELLHAMRQAGVPLEDISNTLDEAAQIDSSVNSIGEDQRKNLLVAMFVNSGHVKLVHKQDPIAGLERRPLSSRSISIMDRRATLASLVEEERRTSSSSFTTHQEESAMEEIAREDPIWEESIREDPIREESVRDDSARDDVLSSEVSFDASVRDSKSQDMSRKSKLDKIAELKKRNSIIKRENKSLKKTVKKLLGQLTTATKEKDEQKNTVNEGGEEGSQEEALDHLPRSSLHCIEETDDTKDDVKKPQEVEDNDTTSSDRPPYDVVVHAKLDGSSRHSMSSEKSSSKDIVYLKRKLKKEKEAHQNTEFRMKAELDILTYEVDGLQRELGNTLESLDNTKKRARESRDSVSKLKNELRSSTTKVKELTAEAEARDKLIETFTKILLQKVGVEGGGEDGQSIVNEEKMGDEVSMDQAEKSFGGLDPPT